VWARPVHLSPCTNVTPTRGGHCQPFSASVCLWLSRWSVGPCQLSPPLQWTPRAWQRCRCELHAAWFGELGFRCPLDPGIRTRSTCAPPVFSRTNRREVAVNRGIGCEVRSPPWNPSPASPLGTRLLTWVHRQVCGRFSGTSRPELALVALGISHRSSDRRSCRGADSRHCKPR
jgi:hypothetical protein